MAETIQNIIDTQENFKEEVGDIYEAIHQEVTDEAQFEVDSTSRVAEYRLWEYVVAAISWLQQSLWDIKKAELEEVALNAPPGNARWLEQEARAFQLGYDIVFDPVTRQYGYTEEDEDSQIIKRVAIEDVNGVGILKVAKETNGVPEKLSDAELNAFQSYIQKIQVVGSNLSIVSLDADELTLPTLIKYDPIIPLEEVKSNVEEAINTYLSSIDFNGTFETIRLIDAVQLVDGVTDVIPGEYQFRISGQSITDFDRNYSAASGYFIIDPTNTLEDTLTYEL